MTGLCQHKHETATNELRFVYDGWNLIATLNSQLSTLNSFAWGLDLSGSQQGAGGVGGLLWVNDLSTLNGQPSTCFVSFDGNGNVVALFNAANSSDTARYEYGPFGEVVRTTGPIGQANPFRFSTKYQDDETDLLYYGYRYYSASTGRWLSRDPIGEKGGANLYGFVGNDSVDYWDALGLQKGAEHLMNPQPSPSKQVVPGVTIRRLVGPGGHQWMYLQTGYHIGVNKGEDKGKWVDETGNRPRDYLENPASYYEWEVVKRNLGWMHDKTPCKCATIEQVQQCIGASILYEFAHGTPKKFNIVCNNCRDNSERILKRCCAQKGRLLNNPDDSNAWERFFRDWFKGPFVYLPMASGGN